MEFEYKFISKNKIDTINLGIFISKFLNIGNIILLTGDLGAGKTTFTQGIAKGLSIKDNIISPTFNILKCYFNKTLNLYHIDAYRLKDQNLNIGLEEFIEGDGVCVIEWPIYIKTLIPKNKYLNINFTFKNNGEEREIILESNDITYKKIFDSLNLNYV